MKQQTPGNRGMVGSSRRELPGGIKVLITFAAVFAMGCAYVLVDIAFNAFVARTDQQERIARVVHMYERNGAQITPEVMRRIEAIQPRGNYKIAGAGDDMQVPR